MRPLTELERAKVDALVKGVEVSCGSQARARLEDFLQSLDTPLYADEVIVWGSTLAIARPYIQSRERWTEETGKPPLSVDVRFVKRETRRKRRREERRDPENAPKKNTYRGWST